MYKKSQSHDICFLTYGVQKTEFFLILGHFLPFYHPPSTSSQPRKSKFWKNEKITWIYYHFTYVYHKWPSYNAWFLRYRAQKTEFFVILNHFLQFYPSKNLLNQNFWKIEKRLGYIIILQRCTINDSCMKYGSWDMEHNRQNFC